MTPDEWLARNTIECKPYRARLSPAACAANQAGSALTCCPCENAVQGVEPLAKQVKRAKKGKRQVYRKGESPYRTHFTDRPETSEHDAPAEGLPFRRPAPPATQHHRSPHVWAWGVDHCDLPETALAILKGERHA